MSDAWGLVHETEGRHAGHISHCHESHGNAVMCTCGAVLGCFSIAIPEYPDDYTPPPETPCPLCQGDTPNR